MTRFVRFFHKILCWLEKGFPYANENISKYITKKNVFKSLKMKFNHERKCLITLSKYPLFSKALCILRNPRNQYFKRIKEIFIKTFAACVFRYVTSFGDFFYDTLLPTKKISAIQMKIFLITLKRKRKMF